MAEIQCPHCGKTFTVDESHYAAIVKQVRDKEFEKELAERLRLVDQSNKAQMEALVAKTREESRDELEQTRKELAQAREKAIQQESQLKQAAQAQHSLDQETIAKLTAQIEESKSAFATQKQLAVSQAVSERDLQIQSLQSQVKTAAVEKRQIEDSLKKELLEKVAFKDQTIRDKEDEIERLRNQRSRLSVKLIGETLEQHCEMEFNRVRMMAFPHAEFHKDNDVVDGTKGDYVFREKGADGVEVVSIMFDMKNEDDNSTNRKKNEDHLKKLDKDRRDKGCEYAVLVSTLEPESDLYNSGIVDVSYLYPKMYVIRPQFFLPLISLLRNAGMNAVEARHELAEIRQQNIDITNFENKLEEFRDKFGKNYEAAGKKFNTAIDEIDKSIDHLQKVKDALLASEKQLKYANDKVDRITIRSLTHGNPTMKAKFKEARALKEAAEAEEETE